MATARNTTTTTPLATVNLVLNRETKNTYRFDDPAGQDGDCIPSLYVKKSAFPDGAPESISVTVSKA